MKTLREYIDIVEGKESREAELDRKFNSPEQLKKDADYRAYRKAVKQSRKQQPAPLPEDENQEYTVRVVDEEGSGYTVKVTATSEQGALHKAIVKVRNSGARPEHARIIRQDVEEQATPEAIARIEQLSSK